MNALSEQVKKQLGHRHVSSMPEKFDHEKLVEQRIDWVAFIPPRCKLAAPDDTHHSCP